jgi:hypothetical protein
VVKLEIPNDTRFSGAIRMYELLLRSKYCVTHYCTYGEHKNLFIGLMLTDEEWSMIAETHSVLKITNLLAMTSQTQTIDSNCLSYYNVHTAWHILCTSLKYKVVDLDSIKNPTTLMKENRYENCKKINLLPYTTTLINRFHAEFDHYFNFPDSDQQLMMVFHPLMVRAGFE